MRERRIPTLLGLFLIVASLGATVFFFKNITNFFGLAGPDAQPSEVKITNVSESGFSVSWVTSGSVSGTINYGEDSFLGKIAADDRDQTSGKTGKYLTHHVSLRYLKPATKYYFKIISSEQTFDDNAEPYLVTTAPEVGTSTSQVQPVYGSIIKADGGPAVGAIVYLNFSQATPLSTLVKSSGNWLVTLNNVRTADLADFAKPSENEKMEIFVLGENQETARATTTINNAAPVPQITLGKNYNFAQEVTASPTTKPTVSPSATPSATATPSASFSIPAVATSSPSLISPQTEADIPSDRPVFKGTGVPGKIVTIKVESSNPVTATVTVDQNGNWNWTPPAGLPPGDHTVTITTTDSAGKPVKLTRNFTVLASGTQVAEAATPSATPKSSPTPTPTPTLKPTPKATPVSTSPASGNLTPTIFISLLGLTLLVLGLGKLLLLDNS